MQQIHEMMLEHIGKQVSQYCELADAYNNSMDDKSKKFNLWLERVQRINPEANTVTMNALNGTELSIRSEMNIGQLAFMHDWLKAQLKIVDEFLFTHQMTSAPEVVENSQDLDKLYNEICASYKAMYELYKAKVISIEDLNKYLPIKMAKTPRGSEEVPKLNIPKLKSGRKQIRENSTHMKLVVNGQTFDEPIGIAIKNTLGYTLTEFQAILNKADEMNMYDLADGQEFDISHKETSVIMKVSTITE